MKPKHGTMTKKRLRLSTTLSQLTALVVTSIFAASCTGSDDVVATVSAGECVFTEAGDTWSGVTRELGLDSTHWEGVRSANPQAGSEDILFVGMDVCLTADQRTALLGGTDDDLNASAEETPTTASAEATTTSTASAEATTTSTASAEATTTSTASAEATTTSTASAEATTTSTTPADVDLSTESGAYFTKLDYAPNCDVHVRLRNYGDDDAENVTVLVDIEADGGAWSVQDFELGGPSRLKANFDRYQQYTAYIGLAMNDRVNREYQITVRVEVGGVERFRYENRSTIRCR